MVGLQYPIRLVLNGQASKEIEWHCKHYVGRGLMKKFDSGEALAKEMGLKPEQLKKTFDDYNTVVRTKKDPFGKKVRPFSSPLLSLHPAPHHAAPPHQPSNYTSNPPH